MEELMEKSLDKKRKYKLRAKAFDDLYEEYCKKYGNDDGWWNYRVKLRKKFIEKITKKERESFGLLTEEVKKSFFDILKNKNKQNSYPSEFFYQLSLSIIRKLSKKNDSILEIGCGEFPILENILKKENVNYFGFDPSLQKSNKKNLFRGKIYNLPEELNQKYNLILANMVYTINYTFENKKIFKWELENKLKLLKIVHNLLSDHGYFISIDDIGTIFSKTELEKYFKILIYEKDFEVKDFNNGEKVIEYCKITILRKK